MRIRGCSRLRLGRRCFPFQTLTAAAFAILVHSCSDASRARAGFSVRDASRAREKGWFLETTTPATNMSLHHCPDIYSEAILAAMVPSALILTALIPSSVLMAMPI